MKIVINLLGIARSNLFIANKVYGEKLGLRSPKLQQRSLKCPIQPIFSKTTKFSRGARKLETLTIYNVVVLNIQDFNHFPYLNDLTVTLNPSSILASLSSLVVLPSLHHTHRQFLEKCLQPHHSQTPLFLLFQVSLVPSFSIRYIFENLYLFFFFVLLF